MLYTNFYTKKYTIWFGKDNIWRIQIESEFVTKPRNMGRIAYDGIWWEDFTSIFLWCHTFRTNWNDRVVILLCGSSFFIFYEKSDAKKSQWIKCVKSDILELNNGVIRLFIRERIQNNYIFTCILKGRDEYSLKGKVSWIIEMCV